MKKPKKVLILIAAFALVLSGVFVFVNRKPSRPTTNLEFWIGDKVNETSFSDYQEKYGLFGGREYYGTGYIPAQDKNGMQIDPEHCVIYTVTAYPDYSSKKKHITGIYITDPTVEFYSISLNSSFEEFDRLMKKQGFRITDTDTNYRRAEKGKYSVTFTNRDIRIRVEVRNIFSIQF